MASKRKYTHRVLMWLQAHPEEDGLLLGTMKAVKELDARLTALEPKSIEKQGSQD